MRLYRVLCRVGERALSRLRITHLRLSGIEIGERCSVGRGVRVLGNVRIGDDTVIGDFTYIGTMAEGWVEIGRDCLINSHTVIGAASAVTIGDHCIFAPYVHITDATHGIDDSAIPTKHAPVTAAPVRIGPNVWLGSGVMVMSGAEIGEGAVLGAKALVNAGIPPFTIAVGIPARPLRERARP